ncbi:protein kinase family protein, partial [Salmonella enterica]|uniref:protein kinase family protein n=1 Tax=Salmonella enterica TaxID=28901 RepID=UPI0011BE0388
MGDRIKNRPLRPRRELPVNEKQTNDMFAAFLKAAILPLPQTSDSESSASNYEDAQHIPQRLPVRRSRSKRQHQVPRITNTKFQDIDQTKTTEYVAENIAKKCIKKEKNIIPELKVLTIEEAFAMGIKEEEKNQVKMYQNKLVRTKIPIAFPGTTCFMYNPSTIAVPFKYVPQTHSWDRGTRIYAPNADDQVVPLNLVNLTKLGEGGFGQVYKYKNYACKIQRSKLDDPQEGFVVCEEALIASRIKHPNITTFVKGFLMKETDPVLYHSVLFYELGSMCLSTFIKQDFWINESSGALRRFLRRRF